MHDKRDAVASLMFRNRGERWGHLEVPGWRELLKRYPQENHIRCAHQWRYAVATAREDAKLLPAGRYLEVRYEDLVHDAPATMARVREFLGLGPDPHITEFLSKIQDVTDGSYHAKRQVRHYVHNHTRRIGRYRENLTARQLEDVVGVCGSLLADLGYDS